MSTKAVILVAVAMLCVTALVITFVLTREPETIHNPFQTGR